jgi:hypothetical protein
MSGVISDKLETHDEVIPQNNLTARSVIKVTELPSEVTIYIPNGDRFASEYGNVQRKTVVLNS